MGFPNVLRASLTNRSTRTRGVVLVLACGASWLLYLHRYTWGIVSAPIRQEAARRGSPLSPTDVGWLDSAFNIAYGIGQIPGGWVADRFGPRVVLSTSVALWSLVLAAIAFVGGGFLPLLGLRALFGLAQAAAFPCLSKVTRSWFAGSVRTAVQGLVASMSARAGGACSSLIMASLLLGLLGMDWRNALLVLAIAGLVFAVVFALVFRNRPAEHPWLKSSEAESPLETEAALTIATSYRFQWSGANQISLAFFLVHAFASAFADNFFVYWIPRFLVEVHGLQPVKMGIYTSLPLWGGALGGVCGGVLNDLLIRQTGRRRLGRSAVALTGKGLASGLILAGVFVGDPFAAMLALALCKFFSDWSQASLWGTVTDIAGPASGRVFGIVNTAGNIGAAVAGPLMGRLTQEHGWDALFFALSGVYAVAALSWLVIDCTRPLVVESPS